MTSAAESPTVRGLYSERIYPGTESVFDGRYRQAIPGLIDESRRAGIRQLTWFRRGLDVWFYAQSVGDVRQAVLRRNEMPARDA